MSAPAPLDALAQAIEACLEAAVQQLIVDAELDPTEAERLGMTTCYRTLLLSYLQARWSAAAALHGGDTSQVH